MPEIEDELSDIVSKAQRGLGISTSQLAARTQLEPAAVRAARTGEPDEATIRSISPFLGLQADGLWKVHQGTYAPKVDAVDGFTRIDTPAPTQGYEEMQVNAFLLHQPERNEAVLFDTGTSLSAILDALGERDLKALCVTHTHWDHIVVLEELIAYFPEMAVYGPPLSKASHQTTLEGVEVLNIAGLDIAVKPTRGHAHDGLSYIVRGLTKPIAIVGDAIFAGSVGGIPAEAYEDGLKAISEHLLTLEPETIIAPGHAGLTTVDYERAHNPFF
jgi:glyoxylase-like metal-dependent hydrolase (beta-lactamase superfamily II)|tara:strand:- start:796 stop:1614 length:819 start_codon:yes stop_codon:yes gene_type:complete